MTAAATNPASYARGATVAVRLASFTQLAPQVERFMETLSPDEVARARRFYFPRDRERYVIARGMLRRVLAEELSTDPGCLIFVYGAHGKPFLRFGELHFNVAHSGDRVVIATSAETDVGVDVEQIRAEAEILEIARRFFAEAETAALERLPETCRQRAAFDGWVRKEALLKGVGCGLRRAMDRDVVFTADGRLKARVVVSHDDETRTWSLRTVYADKDYICAVAAAAPRLSCVARSWPGPAEGQAGAAENQVARPPRADLSWPPGFAAGGDVSIKSA